VEAGDLGGRHAREHIRTEFSTYWWLLEPMLAETSFEVVSADFDRKLYGADTCVKTSGRQNGIGA
jgi:hypothetical protein